jgi:hypothetical protein
VTGWICRHPDNLVDRDTEQLQQILDRCPELRSAAAPVRSFADMMTHPHGERLTAWMTAAEHAALPGISSEPVEANVNRIKMIKRQMYGGAGFDLLRKRVPLAG